MWRTHWEYLLVFHKHRAEYGKAVEKVRSHSGTAKQLLKLKEKIKAAEKPIAELLPFESRNGGESSSKGKGTPFFPDAIKAYNIGSGWVTENYPFNALDYVLAVEGGFAMRGSVALVARRPIPDCQGTCLNGAKRAPMSPAQRATNGRSQNVSVIFGVTSTLGLHPADRKDHEERQKNPPTGFYVRRQHSFNTRLRQRRDAALVDPHRSGERRSLWRNAPRARGFGRSRRRPVAIGTDLSTERDRRRH